MERFHLLLLFKEKYKFVCEGEMETVISVFVDIGGLYTYSCNGGGGVE